MHSSTSSFKPSDAAPTYQRELPLLNVGAAWTIALLLCVVGLLAWEWKWRAFGVTPTYQNSDAAWAAQRRRISNGEGDKTVLIGSSRVLFGVQLGGGTDINRALAYCQELVTSPADTVLVLVSDLYEGGVAEEMVRRARELVASGVTVVALLALSDSGAPAYDAEHAAALSAVGVPAFACTPDLFPDLMGAAIEKRDLSAWAASHDIVTSHADDAAAGG